MTDADPVAPQTCALRCAGVTQRLRSGDATLTVLDDVHLCVEPGEVVAIVGPSGSGKSTLLGLLAGLDRPTAGEVWVQGQPLSRLGEDALSTLRRAHIGFVFHNFQLLPNLTAFENISLPLELTGAPEPAARAEQLLSAVGLAGRAHHYPSQLSGGEQQRVALARAFAGQPAILLADEPTGNLDPKTAATVLDLLFELRSTRGTTLVIVTHDAEIAARADRRIRLQGGALVQDAGA